VRAFAWVVVAALFLGLMQETLPPAGCGGFAQNDLVAAANESPCSHETQDCASDACKCVCCSHAVSYFFEQHPLSLGLSPLLSKPTANAAATKMSVCHIGAIWQPPKST